jgi:hypothetical protein
MFSVRSMPGCYKQNKLVRSESFGEWVSEITPGVQSWTVTVKELVAEAREQLGNPEEGECPALEAATK